MLRSPTSSRAALVAVAFAAMALALFGACTEIEDPPDNIIPTEFAPREEPISIVVEAGNADGTLHDPYLGVTIDTAEFVNSRTEPDDPGFYEGIRRPDLSNPRLRALVRQLMPGILRIGGTVADGTYFCEGEGDCDLPESYQISYRDAETFQPGYWTRDDIREIADFAEATDARVSFCLNFGPGPRDADTGAWTDADARRLIRFARGLDNGDRFDIWEAGNEVNGFFFNFKMPGGFGPDQYADDLRVLRDLIDEEDPGGRLLALGSYYYPVYFVGDVFRFSARTLALARDVVDIASWHLYPTQSDGCGESPLWQTFPATAENLFDENIVETSRAYASDFKTAAKDVPVFLGESASAQCGGQDGVSNRLADALWWADWIGVLASEGTGTFVRQSLAGLRYGIVEHDTWEPYPTWYTIWLYKNFVAKAHLKTTTLRHTLKAHGFCGTESGRVTIVIANPQAKAREAIVELSGAAIESAVRFDLTSPGGLAGRLAFINGVAVDEAGNMAMPEGEPVDVTDGVATLAIAGESLTFVSAVVVGEAEACQ
ncbi:hypothetical protein K8I61_10640 [bacterium]|nr:hypothetical protein [bacterium]